MRACGCISYDVNYADKAEKCGGGGWSSKGLHEHLKRVRLHDITVLKRMLADEESHSPSPPKRAAGSSILSYVVQQNDNTLSATLAHMTARDGLPFRDIARLTKRSYCNGFRQLATF